MALIDQLTHHLLIAPSSVRSKHIILITAAEAKIAAYPHSEQGGPLNQRAFDAAGQHWELELLVFGEEVRDVPCPR